MNDLRFCLAKSCQLKKAKQVTFPPGLKKLVRFLKDDENYDDNKSKCTLKKLRFKISTEKQPQKQEPREQPPRE
jgi:hypothetical protein